jgi:hypothetical protein
MVIKASALDASPSANEVPQLLPYSNVISFQHIIRLMRIAWARAQAKLPSFYYRTIKIFSPGEAGTPLNSIISPRPNWIDPTDLGVSPLNRRVTIWLW